MITASFSLLSLLLVIAVVAAVRWPELLDLPARLLAGLRARHLQAGKLVAGGQLVIGHPSSSGNNGFPQWDWPGMSAGSVKVPDMDHKNGVVVLFRGDHGVSGVTWGATTMLGVQHADPPTPGRSLIWTGDEQWVSQWQMAPSSPNQLPRWRVAGIDPEPLPPTPEELQKLAAK